MPKINATSTDTKPLLHNTMQKQVGFFEIDILV